MNISCRSNKKKPGGSPPGLRICFVWRACGSRTEFKPGEVVRVKNYDVAQTIHGVPAYLGAIQSMLLNEDAMPLRNHFLQINAHLGHGRGISFDEPEYSD